MVTLRATQAMTRTLTVRSGQASAAREVKLAAGETQNVFLDLKAAGETIEARLDGQDDFDGDDAAWLARGQSWRAIETRTGVSEELRRMVEVYGRHRPAGEAAGRVIVARPGELKDEEAGVMLAATTPAESPRGPVETSAHAIVAGVDWSGVGKGVALARDGPGEGWTKVAWVGDRTIVAVREGTARQVWVGFESREFARTPGFVVFWTSVFDWVGGAGEGGFASMKLEELRDGKRVTALEADQDGAHWPGVFETGAGKVAANVAEVKWGGGDAGDWARRLGGLRLSGRSDRPLAGWLALGALACVLGAAGLWEKRRASGRRVVEHLEAETIERVEAVMPADGQVHRVTRSEQQP
jgi:hypothetical protein